MKINAHKKGRGFKLKAPIIRKVLELRGSKLSMNEINQLTGVSKGSISSIIAKAAKAVVNCSEPQKVSDEELLALMYPKPEKPSVEEEPNFDTLRDEMSRPDVRVNAQLLWEEFHEHNPEGIKRSTFYGRLKQAGPMDDPKPNMHQVAKGGEKLLIDYSGLKASYFDSDTGNEVKVEIFVANWMASSYLYVEASPSQRKEDWISSHVRALRFYGCAPTYLVPDNLRSGVTKANYYDPTINRVYDEMSKHYDSTVLPARARKPQDKASVESNVRFIQTHLLGRLRNRRFTSLEELNKAIWELLPQINDRKMHRYHRSRRERFEDLDKPHARPLPPKDFYVSEIKDGVRVEDDHHIRYKDHFYSVPWRFTGTRVDLWLVGSELLVYAEGERIASHPVVINDPGGYSTNDLHRPPNHLFVRNLKPLWVLSRAESIGPRTHNIIANMIAVDPSHSEAAIRKGLGIVEFTRDYPKERVESAVAWAIDHAMVTIEDIGRVLKQNLDDPALNSVDSPQGTPCLHDNIRGENHYTKSLNIL